MEGHAPSGGRDQFAFVDPFAFDFGIAEERPLDQRFMSDAAPTRFLPGKLFVEEKDLAPGPGKICRGKRSCRTAANDRNGTSGSHFRRSLRERHAHVQAESSGNRLIKQLSLAG